MGANYFSISWFVFSFLTSNVPSYLIKVVQVDGMQNVKYYKLNKLEWKN